MTASAADQPVVLPPDTRVRVRLVDLGLAPENLRAHEPPDEGIARLADTIEAAGVLYPPIVRPARKGEAGAYLVLDGRRRRYAWLALVERGRMSLEDEVECVLMESRAAQAAAVVLTATEQVPVHLADVIRAIGKLRKARLSTAGIAAALGYAELEIRRLEALSAVHSSVLDAFRQGRLTLRQVRLFARLPDTDRQAELARTALDGYFQEYQLQQAVQRGRVTVEADALRLVGSTAYAAAGGRVSADLFGEMPDVLLDPEILQALWRARAAQLAEVVVEAGVAVHLGDERGLGAPEGLQRLPYVYEGALPETQRAAWRAARGEVVERRAALEGLDLSAPEADAPLAALLSARVAEARSGLIGGVLEAVLLHPCGQEGLDASFFWREIEAAQDEEPPVDGDPDENGDVVVDLDHARRTRAGGADIPAAQDPAPVAVAGLGHALHERRTDLATRGLARDLADHPGAALTALTAQLFKQLVLRDPVSLDTSALAIVARDRGAAGAVANLDGEVRTRLAARRADFLSSGLRPIPWVDSLLQEDQIALLAETVALCVDLRETRTASLRPEARAEAAEIADLCGADLARHWVPDPGFLQAHSRAQLLAMLAEMGAVDPPPALKKGELVDLVAQAAADRGWAPAALTWRRPVAEPTGTADVEMAEPEPGAGGEGAAGAASAG